MNAAMSDASETSSAYRVAAKVRTKPGYGKRHETFIIETNEKSAALDRVASKPDVATVYPEHTVAVRVDNDGLPVGERAAEVPA